VRNFTNFDLVEHSNGRRYDVKEKTGSTGPPPSWSPRTDSAGAVETGERNADETAHTNLVADHSY